MREEPSPTGWIALTWVWLAVRSLFGLGLAAATVLLVAGGVAGLIKRPGVDAVAALVYAAGTSACLWFLARDVRAAWRNGVSQRAVRSELKFYAVMGAFGAAGFAVVWPSFSNLMRFSREGANKGNLGQLREAVSVYAATHGGAPPESLEALVASHGLPIIPTLAFPTLPHSATRETVAAGASPADTGRWAYRVDVSSGKAAGVVFIDCTHTDSKGSAWASY